MLKAIATLLESRPRLSLFRSINHSFCLLTIITVGVVIAGLAFEITKSDSERLVFDRFDDSADAAGLAITSSISAHVEPVLYIQDLYKASEFVSRDQFKIFSSRVLDSAPDVRGLSWIQRVKRTDRERFESEARAIGHANFSITERNSEGLLISAGERDEYFPVYHIEPMEGNDAALGFDLATNPSRLAALNEARDSGNISVTSRIKLVQETGTQFGILVLAPIYSGKTIPGDTAERRDRLEGFVSGVYRMGDVITHALGSEEHNTDVDVALFDTTDLTKPELLFSNRSDLDGKEEVLPESFHTNTSTADRFGLSEIKDKSGRCNGYTFSIGDRSYVLMVAAPDGTFMVNYRTPILVVMAVLLLTFITAVAVSVAMSRTKARETFFTERVQATEQLQAVTDDLERLIETANAPIFGVDIEGNINEWNAKIARTTGYTRDEIMGKDLVDAVIPEHNKSQVKAVVQAALQGEATENYESHVQTSDGRILQILLNSTPRRDGQGNITGAVGVGQDITERVQATEQLQAVTDDLERLIETANAPIFGVDIEGNINEWNAKIARTTGYTRDEIMGKDLVDAVIPEHNKSQVKAVVQAALQGEATENYESHVQTSDGRILQILLNSTPRRDGQGNITGAVGVGQDITERVETELERNRLLGEKAGLVRQLLQAQEEERGAIAYDLHDGPAQNLSGASMFLESYVALTDEIDTEESELMIPKVKSYVGSALEEIQRIMAGLRPSLLDDLGLVQSLRESANEVARLTGHSIEFNTLLNETTRFNKTVEIVLYRISQEAVNNAVKHSSGERIVVELAEIEGQLVLTIKDNGSGFDVDSVMNSAELRGMGLLGMRERAALIDAALTITSEPDDGTLVTVTLASLDRGENLNV